MKVSHDDLRNLLNGTSERPVLYIKLGPDNEGGEPELDVWDEAYVNNPFIITSRANLLDFLGVDPLDFLDGKYEPITDTLLDEYLSNLDEAVASALTCARGVY